jgi:hypothetical protein
MRELADDEVAAVATWERTEVERIEAEAKRRSEERRARLETELADDARRTEQEIEETKRRARAYESELDSFLAQLGEIRDPAEFVSAAQRMPPPPLGGDTAASAPSPAESAPSPAAAAQAEPTTATRGEPAAVQARQPTQPEPADEAATTVATPAVNESAATPAPEAQVSAPEAMVAAPESDAAEAVKPAAATPAAPAEPGAETATSVIVKGLGSFGAITSFKQSLERAGGVRTVALSLGPTGEFVYRATHSAETDLAAVIGTIEEGSTVERQPDGSLRVTVGRSR